MNEGKFQDRVLQLLCELKNSTKEMGHKYEIEDSTYHVTRISTTKELMSVEKDMKDPSKRLQLINQLSRIGGEDAGACVNNVLHRLMTNNLMEKMNTTGRSGKMSYENMDLAQVVEESVLKSCGGTEAAVWKKVMPILKYAKYRIGGSAHKPGVPQSSDGCRSGQSSGHAHKPGVPQSCDGRRSGQSSGHAHKSEVPQSSDGRRSGQSSGHAHKPGVPQSSDGRRSGQSSGHAHKSEVPQSSDGRRSRQSSGHAHKSGVPQSSDGSRSGQSSGHAHKPGVPQSSDGRRSGQSSGHAHKPGVPQSSDGRRSGQSSGHAHKSEVPQSSDGRLSRQSPQLPSSNSKTNTMSANAKSTLFRKH